MHAVDKVVDDDDATPGFEELAAGVRANVARAPFFGGWGERRGREEGSVNRLGETFSIRRTKKCTKTEG